MISSLGGCFLGYQRLLGDDNIERDLRIMKVNHTSQLKSALNLHSGQVFLKENLKRFKLLQAVARGDKIFDDRSRTAKYLLARHGEIQAFLGIHPEGYLV